MIILTLPPALIMWCNIRAKCDDFSVVEQYPELDRTFLAIQLKMFLYTTGASNLEEAKSAYRDMEKPVRAMFPQILTLLKLLLVCPVSSSECERSFSALRRLKTWLRNTMSQKRLNYVSVCHVHQSDLDSINLNKIAKDFAERSDIRRNIFGSFL